MICRCIAAILLLAVSNPAAAVEAPCTGTVAILRVSKILPGGSLEGFKEAVADHMAWYRANGLSTNVQIVVGVLSRNGETGLVEPVKDEVVTLHTDPPPPNFERNRKDQNRAAFIAKYVANSEIELERLICLPRISGAPAR